MAGHRKSNVNWSITTNQDGSTPLEDAKLAVQMDIRTELQKLNQLLHCFNFTDMPKQIRGLRRDLRGTNGRNRSSKRVPKKPSQTN